MFFIIKLSYQHGSWYSSLKAEFFGWYVAGYILYMIFRSIYIVLIGGSTFVFASSSYPDGYLVQPRLVQPRVPMSQGLYSYIASGHSSLVWSILLIPVPSPYVLRVPTWYPPNTRQLHPMKHTYKL